MFRQYGTGPLIINVGAGSTVYLAATPFDVVPKATNRRQRHKTAAAEKGAAKPHLETTDHDSETANHHSGAVNTPLETSNHSSNSAKPTTNPATESAIKSAAEKVVNNMRWP